MSTSTAGRKAGSESSTVHHPFATMRRAWKVRADEELSAEDSASTLFRFFRSEHVFDLRVIVKLVKYLFVLHLTAAILIAFTKPAIHFFYKSLHFFRSTAAHSAFTLLGDGVEAFGHSVEVLNTQCLPLLSTYFIPAIPIYGAVIAWTYLSASTRLGVVDLFACEISTLCRVGTIFDIGKRYVTTYHSEDDIAKKHATVRPTAAEHTADEQLSRSFISQENYFPIFDNNSSDLQSLEALVVGYITEYYTYMKAARDLQRKLASIDVSQISKSTKNETHDSAKIDLWHETVADIIYVLFLGYESARKAITDLIEFQPTRAENTIVILLTELVCFSFLCEYLKQDSVRFTRLQLREFDYERIIPALIEGVKAKHEGNEEYWRPALRTIPELETRYKAAMETLQRCKR